jgi:hypothetical protein
MKTLVSVALIIAGTSAMSSNVHADATGADASKSVLMCTTAASDFRIAWATGDVATRAYATSETFDASVLVTWSKTPNPNGDLMRTGTRLKRLHCGDVEIDVRAGFYNGNPNGELGAADDFAKLTIKRAAHQVEVSLLDDVCADAESPRAQAMRGENSVQAVEGHMDAASHAYRITLFKMACDASGNGKPATQIITWP